MAVRVAAAPSPGGCRCPEGGTPTHASRPWSLGDGRRTGMVFSGAAGRSVETVRSDQELLADAYVAELAAFVDAVRIGTPVPVGGEDARAALAIALAAAASVQTSRPVWIEKVVT